MELSNLSTTPSGAVDDLELANIRPTIEVAIALDDVAYRRGWAEAMRAVSGALSKATRGSTPDEYFEGWIDAVTLAPADAVRLTKKRSRYARGYAAGANAYDLVHRGGGFDAE
jgi:hypothetical protein